LKRLLPENPFRRKTDSEEIKDTSAENRSDSKPFKKENVTLIEDEADLRYTSKKVSKKVPKKSTVQETYELWVEKNSIADIATIRVRYKTNYLRAFCSTDTNQSRVYY
jgi:hypothetical protein